MLTTRRSDSFKEKAQRDQDKTNLDCFESLERNIRVSAAVALDIRNKNVASGREFVLLRELFVQHRKQ
jgi:hypothetical protein